MSAHSCDDRCVCPIHETPLYYAPTSDEHACQNPDCVHAHGLQEDLRGTITAADILGYVDIVAARLNETLQLPDGIRLAWRTPRRLTDQLTPDFRQPMI